MMGVDSVEYHRKTVLARGDDHPGQALAYYASRTRRRCCGAATAPVPWACRGR